MSYEYTESAAKAMFNTVCTAFDNRGWHYERDDEDLVVRYGVKSDDLPMKFIMHVNKEVPFIQIFSGLPVSFPEDKRVEGAVAVAVANFAYANGCFQYDLSDGTVTFKLSQCFRDSVIGDECLQYMISIASGMVENYNDRFFMLAKGMISLSDFLAKEKN